jgi:hypothetical protein
MEIGEKEMISAAVAEVPCGVHLELSMEETDTLIHLLLHAPPTATISEEMAEALLRRLTDAQRAQVRRANLLRDESPIATAYVPGH